MKALSSGAALTIFTVTMFISALLLFQMQPMVGKTLLPKFGGSPGVWLSCMMFFQASLLAGYLYSHLITKYLGVRTQVYLHLFTIALPLVAFAFFPLGFAYRHLDPPAD